MFPVPFQLRREVGGCPGLFSAWGGFRGGVSRSPSSPGRRWGLPRSPSSSREDLGGVPVPFQPGNVLGDAPVTLQPWGGFGGCPLFLSSPGERFVAVPVPFKPGRIWRLTRSFPSMGAVGGCRGPSPPRQPRGGGDGGCPAPFPPQGGFGVSPSPLPALVSIPRPAPEEQDTPQHPHHRCLQVIAAFAFLGLGRIVPGGSPSPALRGTGGSSHREDPRSPKKRC